MKKLLLALVASNVIMLSAVAMAPSRRLVYPAAPAGPAVRSAADTEGAYSPLGKSQRMTRAQNAAAQKANPSRQLVYPSQGSVAKERAAAIRNVKGAQ